MAVTSRSEQHEASKSTDGLPSDLWDISIRKFDDLVSRDEILFGPRETTVVEDESFKVAYQHVPHFSRKPILPKDAPERKSNTQKNPFTDPDPDFVLCDVGSKHYMILQKYCAYRPSSLLCTSEYTPQENHLDASDLAAAWAVLKHFETDHPQLVIYNCGANSGSSQGHKHMQVLPCEGLDDTGFDLFPSRATSTTDVESNIPHVPYVHFVLRLPPNAEADYVLQAHDTLLDRVVEYHDQNRSQTNQELKAEPQSDLPTATQNAHNVLLTKDWICLIPRRHAGVEKGAGANALGIAGVIWTSREKELGVWKENGPVAHLKYLAFPKP